MESETEIVYTSDPEEQREARLERLDPLSPKSPSSTPSPISAPTRHSPPRKTRKMNHDWVQNQAESSWMAQTRFQSDKQREAEPSLNVGSRFEMDMDSMDFDDQEDELDLLAPTQDLVPKGDNTANRSRNPHSSTQLGIGSNHSQVDSTQASNNHSSAPQRSSSQSYSLATRNEPATLRSIPDHAAAEAIPSTRERRSRRNSDPALLASRLPDRGAVEMDYVQKMDWKRGGSVPLESRRPQSTPFRQEQRTQNELSASIPVHSFKGIRFSSPTSCDQAISFRTSTKPNPVLNRDENQTLNDKSSRSSSPTARPLPTSSKPSTQTTSDANLALKLSKQTEPPRPNRSLRQRKAAQLQPYTLEALKYRRELVRNDWEDAVVSQREWQRKEREKRDRRERGEETEQDRLEREEDERKEREEKRKKREELRREREERRKQKEERKRLKEEKRLEMERIGKALFEKSGGIISESEEDDEEDSLDEESQDELRLDEPRTNEIGISKSRPSPKNQITYGKNKRSEGSSHDKGKAKFIETSTHKPTSRGSTSINKANPTPFTMDMDMPLNDPMPTPSPRSPQSPENTSKRAKSRFRKGVVLSEDEDENEDDGILPVLGLNGPKIAIKSKKNKDGEGRRKRRGTFSSSDSSSSSTPSKCKPNSEPGSDEDSDSSSASIKTSGSFDYDAHLKLVRRMVPGNYAKIAVEDIRLIRLEKAYERAGRKLKRGDGHDGGEEDDEDREQTPSTSLVEEEEEQSELAPGQARKIKGKRNEDGKFDLRDLGDRESESDDEDDRRKGGSSLEENQIQIQTKELENLNPTREKLSRYEESLRAERERERREEMNGDDDPDGDDDSDESDEELINYGLQTSRNPRRNQHDWTGGAGNASGGSLHAAQPRAVNRSKSNRSAIQGKSRAVDSGDESSGDEALEVNEYWWDKADLGDDERRKRYRKKEDDVDRMLRRTKGERRRRDGDKNDSGASKPRSRSRKAGGAMTGSPGSGPTHPRRSRKAGNPALQEKSLNSKNLSSDEDQLSNLLTSRPQDWNEKAKAKAGYELPRRFNPKHRPGVFKSNPPVVQMKLRKKLDFINDDILFNWEARMLNQDRENELALQKENQEKEKRQRQNDLFQIVDKERSPSKRSREASTNEIDQSTLFNTPARRSFSRIDSNSNHQSPSVAALGKSSKNRINVNDNSYQNNQSPSVSFPNHLVDHSSSHLSSRNQQTPSSASSPAVQVDPVLLAEQLEAQREEADSWNDFKNVRIDFDFKPLNLGLKFDRESYLGKGRLFELISLSKNLRGDGLSRNRVANVRPERIESFGIHLDPNFNEDEIEKVVPDLFDEIFNSALKICQVENQEGSQQENAENPRIDAKEERNKIEESFRFLSLWLSSLSNSSINQSHFQTNSGSSAFSPVSTANRFTSSLKAHLDHFFDRLRSSLDFTPDHGSHLHGLILKAHWFRIELIWRNKMVFKTCSINGTLTGDFETQDGLNEIDDDSNEFRTSICRMMRSLMRHGLNKTMRSLKDATSASETASSSDDEMQGEESQEVTEKRKRSPVIEDLTAELWVCLIHLSQEASQDDVYGEQLLFWSIYESTLLEWLSVQPSRQSLVESETTWYSIFAILNLSQFSSSIGSATSKVHLTSYWSLVSKALSSIRLRLDESVEKSMRSRAIYKRDQYIKVVLLRCSKLCDMWNWTMVERGSDSVLAKLFDIFNSHKLADLPSERDHDFPSFLREFNENLLTEDHERNLHCLSETTSFHLFIKLLSKAGFEMRENSSNEKEGDKKISRLFSRMSPVRVMNFTRDSPPSSNERSILFNHYTIVMLFLHLVPNAFIQRLRQIKSFLNFKNADSASQVVCIRAMVYVTVIFKHHHVDISQAMLWFSEVIEDLLKEHQELNRLVTRLEKARDSRLIDPKPTAVLDPTMSKATAIRNQRRVASLLVVTLRSIQHVIQHSSLDPARNSDASSKAFPDPLLLQRAWTKDLFESQVAIEPAIGQEALRCVQLVLFQRNDVVEASFPSSNRNKAAPTATENSQDSLDLFNGDDDFNFDDPELSALLGEGQHSSSQASRESSRLEVKEKDRSLAKVIDEYVSSSLFHLISNLFHPDRVNSKSQGSRSSLSHQTMEKEELEALSILGPFRVELQTKMNELLKASALRKYIELVIDCWVGCNNVLVQNGMRTWSGYLNHFGKESFKKFDDLNVRRNLGLRLCQNILLLDPGSYEQEKNEFTTVWFSTIGEKFLSIQNLFTNTLLSVSQASSNRKTHPFMIGLEEELSTSEAVTDQTTATEQNQSQAPSLANFSTLRIKLLKRCFENMKSTNDSSRDSGLKASIYSCLSALLSTLKQCLRDSCLTLDDPVKGIGPSEKARGRIDSEYLEFCASVEKIARDSLGETILKGTGAELEGLGSLIKRKREEMGRGD